MSRYDQDGRTEALKQRVIDDATTANVSNKSAVITVSSSSGLCNSRLIVTVDECFVVLSSRSKRFELVISLAQELAGSRRLLIHRKLENRSILVDELQLLITPILMNMSIKGKIQDEI